MMFAGCGGGMGEPIADAGAVEAEFGTGTVTFEPVVPGQDLVVIAGPQGGFHFHAHARMSGLVPGDPDTPGAPGNPETTFEILAADGARLDAMEPPRQLGYEPAGQGRFVLRSARILLIRNEVVEAMYGTTVRIVLRIEDVDGAVATDEVDVVAVPEEP